MMTMVVFLGCSDRPKQVRLQELPDINGDVLMTKAECPNHWAEHFQWLLNWPPPQVDEDLLNTNSLETNNSSNNLTSPVTAAEVLRSLKNGHTLEVCSITAIVLQTGGGSLIL